MSAFQQVIKKNQAAILSDWMGEMSNATRRSDLMNDKEMKQQASELLHLFTEAAQQSADIDSDAFNPVRDYLTEIAESRVEQGFTPAETAMFILSLKQPIFKALRDALQ